MPRRRPVSPALLRTICLRLRRCPQTRCIHVRQKTGTPDPFTEQQAAPPFRSTLTHARRRQPRVESIEALSRTDQTADMEAISAPTRLMQGDGN
jgi:hypothetical protein